MALVNPTTPIYDTFNRSNENPMVTSSSGVGWITISDAGSAGITSLLVTSNQCAANGTSNQYLNVQDNANCEHGGTIATLGGAGNLVDFLFRLKDVGSVFTIDGYTAKWTQSAGTDTIEITRVDNLSATSLASFSREMAAGDSFFGRMVGSTIEVFAVTGAGAYSSLGTATDSTYAAGGYKAMTIIGTSIRVDNVFGGSIKSDSPLRTRNRSLRAMVGR